MPQVGWWQAYSAAHKTDQPLHASFKSGKARRVTAALRSFSIPTPTNKIIRSKWSYYLLAEGAFQIEEPQSPVKPWFTPLIWKREKTPEAPARSDGIKVLLLCLVKNAQWDHNTSLKMDSDIDLGASVSLSSWKWHHMWFPVTKARQTSRGPGSVARAAPIST